MAIVHDPKRASSQCTLEGTVSRYKATGRKENTHLSSNVDQGPGQCRHCWKMLVHQGKAGNGVLKFNRRYYADRMLKGSSTGKTKKYELEVPLTLPSTDGSWFRHLMLYIRSHTPP
ncbi:hypothetical protein B0H16DRAFT_1456893 [Mycena metata]|uniref:Uncharacterized protein n=1 Tax=Mycena metata TaxID=1033252 RepID=A0AAD7NF96_9AGAR|nr:hypothetical protein B0H16DRAFT_1456893 [Mycena metata]